MDHARTRTTRFRLLAATLSGAATVGSLTAAGLTTGAIARVARESAATDATDAPSATEGAAGSGVTRSTGKVVRWEDRPRRTVVRRHPVVQVAHAVTPGAAVPVPGETL